MKVRVATRASRLSLIQAEIALNAIKSIYPNLEFEIVTVKTKGDVLGDKPLHEIGGVGIFEKEVNVAVLRGDADMAVHSLKDIPGSMSEELEIVYTPPRGPVHDVLVHKSDVPIPPEELPEGSVVGTSSYRRKAQLRLVHSGLKIVDIRGNVDTRIRKLLEGPYDAIVVAEAGIERLNIKLKYYRLPLVPFTPPPGQGIIAVVALRDSLIAKMLSGKSDPVTWAMMRAERSFVEELKAGCKMAVGGITLNRGGELEFIASAVSLNGSKGFWVRLRGNLEEPEKLGMEAAEIVKAKLDEVLR
ncbi:MAG: hydroxymethylbilane synthase [Thermoprotei archaeon]|nr:hydroxymethylbilane synthase [Thermoprotei archaeon]